MEVATETCEEVAGHPPVVGSRGAGGEQLAQPEHHGPRVRGQPFGAPALIGEGGALVQGDHWQEGLRDRQRQRLDEADLYSASPLQAGGRAQGRFELPQTLQRLLLPPSGVLTEELSIGGGRVGLRSCRRGDREPDECRSQERATTRGADAHPGRF